MRDLKKLFWGKGFGVRGDWYGCRICGRAEFAIEDADRIVVTITNLEGSDAFDKLFVQIQPSTGDIVVELGSWSLTPMTFDDVCALWSPR